MTLPHRKSKMVSFRISPLEYHKLVAACGTHGVDSVSELARMAVNVLIGASPETRAVNEQLSDLRERVRMLSADLDQLSRRVEISDFPQAGPQN
jgi:hypothetical protein